MEQKTKINVSLVLMSERTIIEQLAAFDPISLPEMDRVKLMNRVDTKFAFDKNTLIQILPLLKSHYFTLEIEGKRALDYESLYFDDEFFTSTPRFSFLKSNTK